MKCIHLEDSDVLADLGEISDLHVQQCPHCRGRLPGYQQIAKWIAAGETTVSPPDDWEQRTLARISALPVPPRRKRPPLAATLGLACGSLVLLVGVYCVIRDEHGATSPSTTTSDQVALAALRVQLVDDVGWRAAPHDLPETVQSGPSSGHPGQWLHAQASVGSARNFEIRIYRGSRELLVRCPRVGAAECPAPDAPALTWKIPSVGLYQVILLTSQQPIAPPRGTFDQDIAAVLDAGGRSIDVETIEIR